MNYLFIFKKKNAQFLGILIKDVFPLECLCGFAICNASESEEFEKRQNVHLRSW